MALTMLDLAAIEQRPLKKAVMISMFESQLPSPMEQLPVEGAQGLSQTVIRLTDAGLPTTRNLGEAVAQYKAVFADRQETLKIIENKVTLDKVYLDIKTYVQDPLALQMKVYSQVVKNKINDLFINGDPTTDVSDPAGIYFRLNNDPTFNGQSIDAASLDVDASDANRNAWLNYIDEAMTLCGGGDPDIVVVNRQTWVALRAALRTLKLFDTTRDQYDREIMTYGRVKIIQAGQKPANVLDATAAGQVIGNDTQTSVHGRTTTTPMYFFQTKGEDGVKLLQLHALRMTRIGIDPGDPGQYVLDFTWPIGFCFPQQFCVSSVQGLDIT